MRSILASLFFIPALVLGAPTVARQDSQIQIISVTGSGTGCPPGSFSTEVSPDRTVVTLGFDRYHTSLPGAAANRDKSCLLTLNLRYPPGCTSSTVDATFHGFAELATGTSGAFSPSYVYSTGASLTPPALTFAGGATPGIYTRQDKFPASIRGNGGNVQLFLFTRANLTPSNPSASATLTADDATISIVSQAACRK
jgi:hypothetical protein